MNGVTMLILVPINMSVAMLILVPINMSVAMLILILINMSIAMLILVNRYRMSVSRMTEAMFLFGVVQSRHFLVHDVSRNQHSFLWVAFNQEKLEITIVVINSRK
jgi:hypothetical protein